MLVHDIRKNRSQVIDFREVAPLGIPLEGDLQKDTKVRSPPSGPELAGVPSCPLPTAPGSSGRCPGKWLETSSTMGRLCPADMGSLWETLLQHPWNAWSVQGVGSKEVRWGEGRE